MFGPYNIDTAAPFIIADVAPVTLASTDKALYPKDNFPVLGGQFFTSGRKLRIRLFGKITTAATPGNGTFGVYYGTGADANGVLLASSAALTLIASQTNLSWTVELFVHCRSNGITGTLFCTGKGFFNVAVNAAGDFLIPASAAVVSGACDLTIANIISVQFKRSGSTAETMAVQDMEVCAFN